MAGSGSIGRYCTDTPRSRFASSYLGSVSDGRFADAAVLEFQRRMGDSAERDIIEEVRLVYVEGVDPPANMGDSPGAVKFVNVGDVAELELSVDDAVGCRASLVGSASGNCWCQLLV